MNTRMLIVSLLAVTGWVISLEAAPKKGPVVIIRDTGGIAGPDLDFMVWPDHSWTCSGNAFQGRKKGKVSKKSFNVLVAGLKEAGLEKAPSIRPSPAPHSQVMIKQGGKSTNLFLPQDHPLMKTARKLVMDIIKAQ